MILVFYFVLVTDYTFLFALSVYLYLPDSIFNLYAQLLIFVISFKYRRPMVA